MVDAMSQIKSQADAKRDDNAQLAVSVLPSAPLVSGGSCRKRLRFHAARCLLECTLVMIGG